MKASAARILVIDDDPEIVDKPFDFAYLKRVVTMALQRETPHSNDHPRT